MGYEMSSKYIRLTKTLNDPGILIKPEEIDKHIKNRNVDHYASAYQYTEDQLKTFKQTGTVSNIEDVTTNRIWFDFDSKDDVELARKDTIELINRLEKNNIKSSDLEIYWSGQKGFNVVVNTNTDLNPTQVKHLALNVFGKDLSTLDVTLYNPSRIIRVPNTKHQKSGLYKFQLTHKELLDNDVEAIKQAATELNTTPKKVKPVDLDDHLLEIPEVIREIKSSLDFDLTTKPRQWKASKWALMQGYFKAGERDTSTMILSATCKAMGYDKITTYYMCKSALQKSWERFGKGDFTKEDLWQKLDQVFSETWKGGQYSEKEDAFLQKKAEEMGIKELTASSTIDVKGALRIFQDYAKNIDKLTLKTGIKELDSRQRITVGMSMGLIAGPGSGKTTVALQMLHSMSKNGELCIFFSYDMYAPHVIQKIIQKHCEGENVEKVFTEYKNGNAEYTQKVEKLLIEEYPNVEFCFETAQTVDQIYDTIHDAEQKRGKKCRFIVIDYNELVITDISDPTQSSNYVAQKVRELASKEQVCVMSLFQPSKMTGDPSAEIISYRAAKGGSAIEQSVSLMMGMSRPGFDPRNPSKDKFVSINIVKNRMGPTFAFDLSWDGYRGQVRSLTHAEQMELLDLRRAKEEKNDEWE